MSDEFVGNHKSPVTLKWSQLVDAHQPDRATTALLVNALLGQLNAADVKLEIPEDADTKRLAVRCALPFAVVHRRGRTLASDDVSEWLHASVWKKSWTPATRSAWVGLLGESPESLVSARRDFRARAGLGSNGNGHALHERTPERREAGLYGSHHVIFINPHRSRRAAGSEHVFDLIAPWLARHLDASAEIRHETEWKETLLDDVRTLLDELIQNIRGHATVRDRPPVNSVVTLQLDTAEADTPRQLVLTVQDTGPGITETAKPKLVEDDRKDLDDDELVAKLVLGEIEPWGRARGIGLPNVRRACRRQRGDLRVISGQVRVAQPEREDALTREISEFESDGTVVVANLSLIP